MKQNYYITTPIYYPNNDMHIGHSYTTIIADTIARYKTMRGFSVKFLTGTDDHGQKIERAAKERNIEPKVFVDEIVSKTKNLWSLLDIKYDIFMRTTEEFHIKSVQKIFKQLYDQGDIYKGHYEGLYCTPCETFFTERQLVDAKCPDCNRAVEKIKEESYFFKMSNYADRLLKHIEENPDFIMPKSRQNEMINFIKMGIDDLSVSRTSFKWGIPVSFDDTHVVYVWIDALSNYITALGYGSENDSDYKAYWPADVHLVGKDIVRFHSIIWPCILMALGEPLPKQIFGHGFLIVEGDKMSKSKGNVVDPSILVKRYGVDAIRYFLLREMPLGQDSNFTNEMLIQRINSDLSNDLGNLLSRTVGMIDKYFKGVVSMEQVPTNFDNSMKSILKSTVVTVENCLDNLQTSEALDAIWVLIGKTNKYIDETSPWILFKDESNTPKLANVMYMLCEVLRVISILIEPFMPNTPAIIRKQLCMHDVRILYWDCSREFGLLPKNVSINKGAILFPRMEIDKELEELSNEINVYKENYTQIQPVKEYIKIEDFSKIELKIGEIITCVPVSGSDKLLKSEIKVGANLLQIVSGIAHIYEPQHLIGKQVVVVTNLKPAKIRGELSEGMILAASDDNGNLSVITSDKTIENGSVVR
jgi:methionyl-tRNA synthetase